MIIDNLEQIKLPDFESNKRVDFICRLINESFSPQLCLYQGFIENKKDKNILYIDYGIENEISWSFQLKIENYLNCVIKFIDLETFKKIIK